MSKPTVAPLPCFVKSQGITVVHKEWERSAYLLLPFVAPSFTPFRPHWLSCCFTTLGVFPLRDFVWPFPLPRFTFSGYPHGFLVHVLHIFVRMSFSLWGQPWLQPVSTGKPFSLALSITLILLLSFHGIYLFLTNENYFIYYDYYLYPFNLI